ncbi:MAG: glycosyltransferase family 4 protein [Chloroflexota bacterium]
MAKIVRVIARLNVGGPAIHTILLAAKLRPDYETVLVSGVESAAEGNMLPLAHRHGVVVRRIPELGREIHLVWDLVALFKLIRLIRRERPDIVHTHTAKAGLVGRVAAWLCGVPVVVHTFHGHVFRGYFGPVKSRLFVLLERLLARLTDRIIVVNEAQRSELLRFRIAPPDKLVAVPLGLELDAFSAAPSQPGAMRRKWGVPLGAPLVGIVARLVPIKDHRLFLSAAAEVCRRRADVWFAVIGDGELRPDLEAYARELAIPVVFTAWESDLPAVYADLDLVCLTSLNEGSPVALIEALAAGKPVVATAVGGVADVVDDGRTGLLVHNRNPVALADAIVDLLASGGLRRQLGEDGRRTVVEKYDIERLVRDVKGIYGELNGKPASAVG